MVREHQTAHRHLDAGFDETRHVLLDVLACDDMSYLLIATMRDWQQFSRHEA